MVDNKEANVINSKCSVCGEKFKNTQECLKHELIKHSLQKKRSSVQKLVNATSKFLKTEEKILERARLVKQLSKCKSGQELCTIFEMFCMKTDNLHLIFTRIQTCLEKELRVAGIIQVYPFGSIASGLALRDCDIDVFLDVSKVHTSVGTKTKNDDAHQRKAFNRINNTLKFGKNFTDVFAIRGARVPIIKCKHKDTGFSIDINVSFPNSRFNTQFISELVNSDARIHEIMLFIKLWAKNMQIIRGNNMTSYCLVTMIIFFLQQPRKLNHHTTGKGTYRILKSIKELQENCSFYMVQGINYAYNLNSEENEPKIPTNITSWHLIKDFFDFYKNFNFENQIISPYYGKAMPKTDLTPQLCKEYHQQLRTITQYLEDKEANILLTDRCMCVQDCFSLNQNTAKNISIHNRQYLTLCLQNAHNICQNPHKLKQAQVYEQLLYDNITLNDDTMKKVNKSKVIMDLENLKLPTNCTNMEVSSENNLTYRILPSKGDLRMLAIHYPDITGGEGILRCWCQLYISAIANIMTKFYRMDMQKQSPNGQKQQKLDEEQNGKELNESWLICCSIDLWTNRCFQRNIQTTFIAYQMEQTGRLYALRRQDPNFSVTLNGIFKLNILPGYMGIEIQVKLAEGAPPSSLNKKSPLRKFFNVFKNTLQSCILKEFLNIEDTDEKTNNEEAVAVSKSATADKID